MNITFIRSCAHHASNKRGVRFDEEDSIKPPTTPRINFNVKILFSKIKLKHLVWLKRV